MSVVWFITGTSRGIGLELVNQLTADPSNLVIATCRNPDTAEGLRTLKSSSQGNNLYIVPLDVSDESSIRASETSVKEILGDQGIDYLINNAAVTEGSDLAFSFSIQGLLDSVKINVAGPALIAQVYLPYLEKGHRKVILNTTSGLASIGLDFGQKNATYSISKTALNMLTYKQAKERPDFIALVLDPGWVKTAMGGEGAMLEPHESVTPILAFLKSVTSEHSGGFFTRDGQRIPW